MVPLRSAGRTAYRGRKPPQRCRPQHDRPSRGSDKSARPTTIFIHNGAPQALVRCLGRLAVPSLTQARGPAPDPRYPQPGLSTHDRPLANNARMDSSIPKAVGFVHLHVHSAYSLREGALTIETLAKLAKADAMPALAITDTNNLFGALEFSEKLAKSGVQPIIGAQTTVDFGDAAPAFWRGVERDNARAPIVLLAQNEAAYRNLMRLVSALWLDPKDGDEAHIPFAALEGNEGLIALTGGPSGPIDRALKAGSASLAESRLDRLAKVFGSRLYVEIQRHGLDSERLIEPQLIDLADSLGAPLVATNEPYFAQPSDYEAHDALLCIAEGALVSAAERRRLLARAQVQDARRDDRALRRSSRGDRIQRRDRDALRLSAADAKADPAALFRCRRTGGRRGSGTAPPGERGSSGAPRDSWPRAGT